MGWKVITYIILNIYIKLDLYHIGYTNFMDSASNINVKYAEVLAIGEEEPSKGTSKNGDIHMV